MAPLLLKVFELDTLIVVMASDGCRRPGPPFLAGGPMVARLKRWGLLDGDDDTGWRLTPEGARLVRRAQASDE